MREITKSMEILNIDTASEFPISGRQLHERLEIGTAYKDWFPRMCEYGFDEGKDFCSKLSESTGGRPAMNHFLTISMAKELCMLQRTDVGRQVRRHLIRVEEAWNSPDAIMARALNIAQARVQALRGKILHLEAKAQEDAPKVLFANSVSCSQSEILVGEMAKLIKQNGVDIGQNRLFERMRKDGYLISRRGSDYNMPTQRSMDLGLMRIKETTITHADGHVSISKTPKVTGKGQVYFINRYARQSRPSAKHICQE